MLLTGWLVGQSFNRPIGADLMILILAACMACLLYDHAITFGQEVHIINPIHFALLTRAYFTQIERMWPSVACSD